MEYIVGEKMDEEVIAEYAELVHPDLINIWKEYGKCTLMDGYLKVINPNDYRQLLDESYFLANESIPIMTTAFGDIITWENNKYICIVRYKNGIQDALGSQFPLFLRLLDNPSFIKDNFQMSLYKKAVKEYGPLEYDECFGFVPLLALGGKETLKSMKKVKIKEHIKMITDLTGGV